MTVDILAEVSLNGFLKRHNTHTCPEASTSTFVTLNSHFTSGFRRTGECSLNKYKLRIAFLKRPKGVRHPNPIGFQPKRTVFSLSGLIQIWLICIICLLAWGSGRHHWTICDQMRYHATACIKH
ncbi:ficolin-1-like [Platysternon megacephalum]|uniref:Ficolin-1-like n=1 Tax=Platysternon megacephalum TaxID=55544 RepID=A0A4D9ELK0_9SAUR|nr:ficolin-1-like [Platysternon megacephalum]